MKALGLDYGAARTGVAVSDATGLLARPLQVVARAHEPHGLDELAALVAANEVAVVVVGLPLTLRGEHGQQADATAVFVDLLRARLDVPVETWDERYTTALAQRSGATSTTAEDALAAAHLLQSWLDARPAA